MYGKTMITRIYVINLKRRPEKLQNVLQALKRTQAPNALIEVYKAIDGKEYDTPLDMVQAHSMNHINKSACENMGLDETSTNPRFKAKVGCCLSHYNVLASAIATSVTETETEPSWCIVLEDDITMNTSWYDMTQNFDKTLLAHSDADMVLLSDRTGISRHTTGIQSWFGTDAYAIKSSAAQRILPLIRLDGSHYKILSPDNMYDSLCEQGILKIYNLNGKPWMLSTDTKQLNSDIEISEYK